MLRESVTGHAREASLSAGQSTIRHRPSDTFETLQSGRYQPDNIKNKMSSVPESAQVPSHQSPSERRYELFSMLDSEDLKTVEETKLIIQENLFASRDPSLINALVDYYLETRSAVALQLLANVHEARSHVSRRPTDPSLVISFAQSGGRHF